VLVAGVRWEVHRWGTITSSNTNNNSIRDGRDSNKMNMGISNKTMSLLQKVKLQRNCLLFPRAGLNISTLKVATHTTIMQLMARLHGIDPCLRLPKVPPRDRKRNKCQQKTQHKFHRTKPSHYILKNSQRIRIQSRPSQPIQL